MATQAARRAARALAVLVSATLAYVDYRLGSSLVTALRRSTELREMSAPDIRRSNILSADLYAVPPPSMGPAVVVVTSPACATCSDAVKWWRAAIGSSGANVRLVTVSIGQAESPLADPASVGLVSGDLFLTAIDLPRFTARTGLQYVPMAVGVNHDDVAFVVGGNPLGSHERYRAMLSSLQAPVTGVIFERNEGIQPLDGHAP
jgi:hypothetical protein